MSDLINKKSILKHFIDWQQQNASVGQEREYNILEMAIKGIENEPTVNELIPCSERLPDELQKVLAYTDKGCFYIARLNTKGKWLCIAEMVSSEIEYSNVIAWQPLPEPIKI